VRKFVIDQGYVILGLLEYHRVSGDDAALRIAQDACELVEKHAWDTERDGYYVRCDKDWTPGSTLKQISAQLAMLDAYAYLHRATERSEHLDKVLEIADIIVDRTRSPRGYVRADHSEGWLYEPTRARGVVWVGYNLKTARFLLRTAAVTGRKNLLDAGLEIVDFCLENGFDPHHGGFFQYMYPSGLLASWKKLWWVQCEGMITLMLLDRMTSDPRYRPFFDETARFCFEHFVDHEHGEWFESCNAAGVPISTTKAFEWKAAFHTVQSSYLVHHLLAGSTPPRSAEIPS
jgi:glucose-6-phosphate isomerase